MHKTLKFKPELAALILAGTKTSTWRLWDDKELQAGDTVDFLMQNTLEHFATVRLAKVIEKPFGALTEEEKSGHEHYSSDEEMYRMISEYYQKPVDPTVPVKVIWFELLKTAS